MYLRQVLVLFLISISSLWAQLTASFQTNYGTFTANLNYQAAPQTVANFVTLAEGTRPWLDPRSGLLRVNTPFYHGLTFHRVVNNFVIQAGSVKGDGSDGPGYSFKDEFGSGLTHNAPYLLSMANSGPNTNGSQFFITTGSSAPHLNNKHTIFGSIISGQSVIDTINNVPTTNQQPNTPVVIQSVVIQRLDAAAQAFDPLNQGLPIVSLSSGKLTAAANQATWTPTNPPIDLVKTHVFQSESLSNSSSWAAINTPVYGLDELKAPLNLGDTQASQKFYRVVNVRDASAVTPTHLRSRTLSIALGENQLIYAFDATGEAGTLTYRSAGSQDIGGPFTIQSNSMRKETHLIGFVSDCPSLNPRYLRVSLGGDSLSPTTILGHHQTQAYNGLSFVDFALGNFTMSR